MIPGSSWTFQDNLKYFRTVWEMLWTVLKISKKNPESLDDSRTVLKICGLSEIFLYSLGNVMDSLEDFRKVWKILRQSVRFPDSLDDFQTVLNISWQSVRCPDIVENFRTVWKISRPSGKFPEQSGRFLKSLEDFWTAWKISRQPWRFLDSLDN